MAAISEKYKNILVGRILKKVQDGVEMNGVVQHVENIQYNFNAPEEERLYKRFKVHWEGDAGTDVLTQEEVWKIATNEFTTASWMIPDILERQKVGWDESALDMEDLRLKSIYDKAMSTHAVNKKAAEAARDIVAALEGRKVQPPQPSLQDLFGQPVDSSKVFPVTALHKYKTIKKQGHMANKTGDVLNEKKDDATYKVLDASLLPPLTPELREEAIRLVCARVAFAETLKQAKEKVKKSKEFLAEAVRQESGEDEPAEEGPEGAAKPADRKLDPEQAQKAVDEAEAFLAQAKVDAEVAAKAARNFEEKHGLLGKDRPSSGQVGRKSAAKENAQPSKAVKPLKETAADAKGKGRADATAGSKKIPFGQSSVRAAQKKEAHARRSAATAAKKNAATAVEGKGKASVVDAADPDAPGPSAGPSKRPSAGVASPTRAAKAAAAAAKRAEKKRAGAAGAKGKEAAVVPEADEEEERERSLTSSIRLNLSDANGDGGVSDDVIVLDSATTGAPSAVAAASDDAEVSPNGDVAMGEAEQKAPAGAAEEEMRRFPDGRAYPERLCMQHGDRLLADWSAAEANNELEDDTEYEVIAILDERKRKGKREFLVKWRGFELNPEQWFPHTLFTECEALEQWEAAHPPAAGQKRSRGRTA